LGADHNPLCRSLDRARSAVVLLCAALLATAAAGACALALAALHGGLASVAQQQAHRHQITAVTTDTAPPGAVSEAPATWTYPAGHHHTAWITVPDGTRTGSSVTTWVDDTGTYVTEPRSATDVYVSSVLSGVGVLVGASLLLLGVGAVGNALVDRRAARAWDEEWSRVEPGWSGRAGHRPPGVN
jgi:hypothetical protein